MCNTQTIPIAKVSTAHAVQAVLRAADDVGRACLRWGALPPLNRSGTRPPVKHRGSKTRRRRKQSRSRSRASIDASSPSRRLVHTRPGTDSALVFLLRAAPVTRHYYTASQPHSTPFFAGSGPPRARSFQGDRYTNAPLIFPLCRYVYIEKLRCVLWCIRRVSPSARPSAHAPLSSPVQGSQTTRDFAPSRGG